MATDDLKHAPGFYWMDVLPRADLTVKHGWNIVPMAKFEVPTGKGRIAAFDRLFEPVEIECKCTTTHITATLVPSLAEFLASSTLKISMRPKHKLTISDEAKAPDALDNNFKMVIGSLMHCASLMELCGFVTLFRAAAPTPSSNLNLDDLLFVVKVDTGMPNQKCAILMSPAIWSTVVVLYETARIRMIQSAPQAPGTPRPFLSLLPKDDYAMFTATADKGFNLSEKQRNEIQPSQYTAVPTAKTSPYRLLYTFMMSHVISSLVPNTPADAKVVFGPNSFTARRAKLLPYLPHDTELSDDDPTISETTLLDASTTAPRGWSRFSVSIANESKLLGQIPPVFSFLYGARQYPVRAYFDWERKADRDTAEAEKKGKAPGDKSAPPKLYVHEVCSTLVHYARSVFTHAIGKIKDINRTPDNAQHLGAEFARWNASVVPKMDRLFTKAVLTGLFAAARNLEFSLDDMIRGMKTVKGKGTEEIEVNIAALCKQYVGVPTPVSAAAATEAKRAAAATAAVAAAPVLPAKAAEAAAGGSGGGGGGGGSGAVSATAPVAPAAAVAAVAAVARPDAPVPMQIVSSEKKAAEKRKSPAITPVEAPVTSVPPAPLAPIPEAKEEQQQDAPPKRRRLVKNNALEEKKEVVDVSDESQTQTHTPIQDQPIDGSEEVPPGNQQAARGYDAMLAEQLATAAAARAPTPSVNKNVLIGMDAPAPALPLAVLPCDTAPAWFTQFQQHTDKQLNDMKTQMDAFEARMTAAFSQASSFRKTNAENVGRAVASAVEISKAAHAEAVQVKEIVMAPLVRGPPYMK